MNEPLPIKNLHQFRNVLANGSGLVITDSTRPPAFHPDPVGCPHVQEHFFTSKVLRNREKNGGYFAVASLEQAREPWPDTARCPSSACSAASEAEDLLESALATATGSAEPRPRHERPSGVETMMDGWASTQRIALGGDGGVIVLRTWPAELKPQAQAVYGTRVGETVLQLVEGGGSWTAEPIPHLAFRTSRPHERFYFECPMTLRQYVESWSRPEDLAEVGQQETDAIASSLWPWLCEQGYAVGSLEQRRELDDYLERLARRRMPALLRPSILLQKRCDADEPAAFRQEVRAAVETLAQTLGESLADADREPRQNRNSPAGSAPMNKR
jgi:hypothetical protein